MCARFSIPAGDLVFSLFDLGQLVIDLEERFNFAPTQVAPVARLGLGESLTLELASWGLTPAGRGGYGPIINARSETALERFKGQMKRRCLVPASGFFEWRTVGKEKQPLRFVMKSGEPFALAGIMGEDGSFAVLTTEPNALVGEIHDRMPCIVPKENHLDWLMATEAEAIALARIPYEASMMRSYTVTKKMGNSRWESPEAILPDIEDQGTLF